MKHPPGRGDAVCHLCPCHLGQVSSLASGLPLAVEANLPQHSALTAICPLCVCVCVCVCEMGMYKLLCCRRDLMYSPILSQKPQTESVGIVDTQSGPLMYPL